MIHVLAFVTCMTGCGPCIATLLRVTGNACSLSTIYAIDNILVFDGLSALFLFYFKFGPVSVVYAYLTGYTLSVLIGTFIIFRYDWRKIPKVDK